MVFQPQICMMRGAGIPASSIRCAAVRRRSCTRRLSFTRHAAAAPPQLVEALPTSALQLEQLGMFGKLTLRFAQIYHDNQLQRPFGTNLIVIGRARLEAEKCTFELITASSVMMSMTVY